jgi:hypothetical protein
MNFTASLMLPSLEYAKWLPVPLVPFFPPPFPPRAGTVPHTMSAFAQKIMPHSELKPVLVVKPRLEYGSPNVTAAYTSRALDMNSR